MTAIAATSFAIPRLPRRARAALLTVHVTTSVGWVGLDGALVALEITGMSSASMAVRAGIATATAVIACWVLVPVVFSSLVSGLILALSTPWGLLRHWWVLAKCAIAGALTVAGLMFLVPQLPHIAAGAGEPAGMDSLVARSAALLLLFAATGLSVIKPWGKTRRGKPPSGVNRSSGRAAPRPASSPHREPSPR